MDKGVAMVIMDKPDYINKFWHFWRTPAPTEFSTRTPRPKSKTLIQTLKDIKQTGGLSKQKYRKLYLTSSVPPSFIAFLNSTKLASPSGP